MSETPGWVHETPLRIYASLDSTNEEARRLVKTGERGPVWIIARRQSAGRGRRGSEWESKQGNLFATLLLNVPYPPKIGAQLSFVAALATGDLVCDYARAARVTLKWPNDVLADGRKLAGILLEDASKKFLAVGIGVNLIYHPQDTEFPATSIAAIAGSAPDSQSALARLVGHWDKWYDLWQGRGFAPLREAWLARAAGFGQRIVARIGDSDVDGVFENLDEDGALLIRRPGGVLSRVTAGEVFFRT